MITHKYKFMPICGYHPLMYIAKRRNNIVSVSWADNDISFTELKHQTRVCNHCFFGKD